MLGEKKKREVGPKLKKKFKKRIVSFTESGAFKRILEEKRGLRRSH